MRVIEGKKQEKKAQSKRESKKEWKLEKGKTKAARYLVPRKSGELPGGENHELPTNNRTKWRHPKIWLSFQEKNHQRPYGKERFHPRPLGGNVYKKKRNQINNSHVGQNPIVHSDLEMGKVFGGLRRGGFTDEGAEREKVTSLSGLPSGWHARN